MKNIIFDMDGTLIDSSKAITNSVNFVRENIGLPPLSIEIVTKNINKPDTNLPKIFYETDEYKQSHRELFISCYHKECIKNIKLYDGIYEILQELSKRFTLNIATNASDFFARKMLNHLKIEKFFSVIIGRNNVKEVKPHPEMIETILKSTKSDKKNTLLIGDSQKDELTAKNAKIDFIFVSWGFGEKIENPPTANNPKELLSMILNDI